MLFGIEPSDGQQPNGPLVQASDGNFYGTTRVGGAGRCFDTDNFCGVIFRVTPGGTETVVHRFGGPPSDGQDPTGPLIQGRDGALYGMTTSGGANIRGTVFKITLGGIYTILYSFGASPSDGALPVGGLVEASDGNFYGTTRGAPITVRNRATLAVPSLEFRRMACIPSYILLAPPQGTEPVRVAP
jgi:uncharacterized repeat protein (TIGR03803 family)